MLVLFLIITLLFMILNFVVFDKDYMHPSFLYCAVFFVAGFVALLGEETFAVRLHSETVIVFFVTYVIFFLVSFYIRYRAQNKQIVHLKDNRRANSYIYVNDGITIALILLELVTIYFFIKYLKDVSIAYDGNARGLKECIELFNNLTKFWTSTWKDMDVVVPMPYRIGNPTTQAASYMLIYVLVNNYIVTKRVNIWQLIAVMLQCVLIVLNGSRSPLFRIILMVFILYYILEYKSRPKKNSDYKFIFRLIAMIPVMAIGFMLMLVLMGRTDTSGSFFRSLYIYIGAPLVNFDSFLVKQIHAAPHELWGGQTFGGLYAYIGKQLGDDSLMVESINRFTYSDNGIETGNVYTCLYFYQYDFGFVGIVILTSIMALYYSYTYEKVCTGNGRKVFDFRLYIYTYLFNDLVMSIFSARFYTTVFDGIFLKLLLFSAIYCIVLFNDKIEWKKRYIIKRS
ncbi:MAG TPA: hypothetical protein DCX21_03345 [Eubacterium sp.]|nr:hypothetical protein [Eubacterium sp.]